MHHHPVTRIASTASSPTMPPALHPRSRLTTSLFTTTLFISFLVVATPHIIPCPVDTRALADSADPDALSTRAKRRRRRCQVDKNGNPIMSKCITTSEPASLSGDVSDEESATTGNSGNDRTRRRECPVPKPGGLVGQILGLGKDEDGSIPPVVKVEPIQRRGRDEKSDE